MLNEIDPYQDILELKMSNVTINNQLTVIRQNQKEIITAINNASERMDALQVRIAKLERKNETT